jgi:hypothetical protein
VESPPDKVDYRARRSFHFAQIGHCHADFGENPGKCGFGAPVGRSPGVSLKEEQETHCRLDLKKIAMTPCTRFWMVGFFQRSFDTGCRVCQTLVYKVWIPFASMFLWSGVCRGEVIVAPLEVRTFGGYYSGAGSTNSADLEHEYWAGTEERPAKVRVRMEPQSYEYLRQYTVTRKAIAKSEKARPLSADGLNPETGKIVWPKALLDNQCKAKRTELEELFELRAKKSSCPESQIMIQETARRLDAQLRTNITKHSATDYVSARKFLNRLAVSGN